MNRWAMLQDIVDAACLRSLECKATERRWISFCSHLGEGYYATAIYCTRIHDFCLHFVMCGWKINMIYACSRPVVLPSLYKTNETIC